MTEESKDVQEIVENNPTEAPAAPADAAPAVASAASENQEQKQNDTDNNAAASAEPANSAPAASTPAASTPAAAAPAAAVTAAPRVVFDGTKGKKLLEEEPGLMEARNVEWEEDGVGPGVEGLCDLLSANTTPTDVLNLEGKFWLSSFFFREERTHLCIGNMIRNEGAQLLGEMLKTNTTLTKLVLKGEWNNN